jgi:hypothetical protein
MSEIHERSPLRVLDNSMHGGLGTGKLGVVCAGAGAGKTAFLVGVALDVVMNVGQVLHVALDQTVDRVRNYYDEIFAELARSQQLERPGEAHLKIERNRRIHTYVGHTWSVANLERTLSFLRSHTDLHPSMILIDGYNWKSGSEGDIRELRRLAAEQNAQLWMSATIDRDAPVTHPAGYPEPVARFERLIDVLLRLKGADGTVHLTLLKDHDQPGPGNIALDLDPTTLLIVKR